MKILELTNFSAGGCGVFARVIEESKLLTKKGHEVVIYSSNIEKGSGKIVKSEETIGNVKIKRFPTIKLGGESFMYWFNNSAKNQALKFKPDVVLAHAYRHPHTTGALKIRKTCGSKVFLVTHAPFARARKLSLRIAVEIYDKILGKKVINKFDKVIAITKWEMSYLTNLGLPKDKIEYIPNGVREEFFKGRREAKRHKIIYTGRIALIKQLENIIEALALIKDKKISVNILGPAEENYLKVLMEKTNNKNLSKRVEITNKTYNIDEQIETLNQGTIFILPSKTEGMPQSLIEAMARGKIIIASDNLASRDLIRDGKNGFIYKNGDSRELANKINLVLNMSKPSILKIKKEAKKSVDRFSWAIIIKKIEKIINYCD